MALSGWCSQHGIPNCAGCRWDGCEHECHKSTKRPSLTGIEGQVRDNGGPSKDGPGDSLRQQRAEVPGPRPTLTRSAEL